MIIFLVVYYVLTSIVLLIPVFLFLEIYRGLYEIMHIGILWITVIQLFILTIISLATKIVVKLNDKMKLLSKFMLNYSMITSILMLSCFTVSLLGKYGYLLISMILSSYFLYSLYMFIKDIKRIRFIKNNGTL